MQVAVYEPRLLLYHRSWCDIQCQPGNFSVEFTDNLCGKNGAAVNLRVQQDVPYGHVLPLEVWVD